MGISLRGNHTKISSGYFGLLVAVYGKLLLYLFALISKLQPKNRSDFFSNHGSSKPIYYLAISVGKSRPGDGLQLIMFLAINLLMLHEENWPTKHR